MPVYFKSGSLYCMKKWVIILFLPYPFLGYAQQKKMCITVDDLPVVSYGIEDPDFQLELTNRFMDTFDSFQVPAIGFVNEIKLYQAGKPVPERVHLLEVWLEHGYELGNHSYSHPDYHKTSFKKFTADILKGERITRELTEKYGTDLKYFRHPFLRSGSNQAQSDSLKNFLHQHGYEEAPVTIDNDDYLFAKAYHKAYVRRNTEQMEKIGKAYVLYMVAKLLYFERSSEALFGRDIFQILLIHASLLNARYLDDLLKAYQDHGYEFVSLTEVLKDPAYEEKITRFGDWGISWLDRWALSHGKKGDFFKGEPTVDEFMPE
jgi:peptidoglycan/xylan/chitin deacetylase (PgdA/CDA1 family)